jgi:hypothetical protein
MHTNIKQVILFSILTFLVTGCMSKQSGKYHTKYSYHPYYSLYAKKMSNKPPRTKKINTKSEEDKSILSLNLGSRFPNNSSKK